MRVYEMIVFVKRFVCLRYYISVFFVGGEIINSVGDYGNAVFVLFHLAVRTHNKSVLVYFRESGKRRNKTYVLTFGRLYGAESTVMRVVNVAHFESCPVAV